MRRENVGSAGSWQRRLLVQKWAVFIFPAPSRLAKISAQSIGQPWSNIEDLDMYTCTEFGFLPCVRDLWVWQLSLVVACSPHALEHLSPLCFVSEEALAGIRGAPVNVV